MKKESQKKRLLAALVCGGALSLALIAGCASGSGGDTTQGAQDAQGADAFDMTLYPEHVSLSEGTDTLAGFHLALGEECTTCHTDTLEEQMGVVDVDGEPVFSCMYYADSATCLSSDCHVSWENLAKQTADLGEYNPHDNPHGRYNCNECHKAHSPQVDRCSFCHDNGGQEMLY